MILDAQVCFVVDKYLDTITEASLTSNMHGCLFVSVTIVHKPSYILLCSMLFASEIRCMTFSEKTVNFTLITTSEVFVKLPQLQPHEVQ